MNIELKPIAESKVRQLGGDVCGVLVRTDGGVMAVSEHGRCARLDAGVMGPVESACMSDMRDEFEAAMAEIFDINDEAMARVKAMRHVDEEGTECYQGWEDDEAPRTFSTAWLVWKRARAQGGQVEETCLPPFDPNKPRDEQGLYGKFLVQRVDGSDLPGGKHHGCKYFVLDVDHDKYAAAALGTYASQCEQEYPLLAKDLREKFGAQGGQGADAVKWSDPAVDPIVSKLYRKFKEWNRQGFGADDVTWCEVRGYVAELLNAQPQPAVPEAKIIIDRVVEELENGFVVCERCGDQEDTATLDCMTDLKRLKSLLTTPTTPQADGRIDHQCELCGHKWSSNDLMDDCVVCTKPAGQEGA